MPTIELESETKKLLEIMAEQEHISVNEIINRLLNTATKEKQKQSDDEENRQHLLEKIRNIKPVKCNYSTEQIVRSLRDGAKVNDNFKKSDKFDYTEWQRPLWQQESVESLSAKAQQAWDKDIQ